MKRSENPVSYPNIEKSGYHAGEYIGYGAGRVWRIWKHRSEWFANSCGSNRQFRGATLREISDELQILDDEEGKRMKNNPLSPAARTVAGLPIVLKINAGNDTNGNPRRGWMIWTAAGDFLRFVEEDYSGLSGLHEWVKHGAFVDLGEIDVAPAAYRTLKKGY